MAPRRGRRDRLGLYRIAIRILVSWAQRSENYVAARETRHTVCAHDRAAAGSEAPVPDPGRRDHVGGGEYLRKSAVYSRASCTGFRAGGGSVLSVGASRGCL